MMRQRDKVFIPAGFSFLLSCVLGCGGSSSSVAPSAAVADSQTVTAYRLPSPPDTQSERESLLKQQLELERQKADIEKQKLEQQLEAERQKTEIEKLRRAQIEKESAAAQREKEAALFTDSSFATHRETIVSAGDSLGQVLLRKTHPTGTYSSTDRPIVTLSSSHESISVSLTVHWKGGFSENNYLTTFSIRLTKRGVDRLEVVRDTAAFQIEPEFLKRAEDELRRTFDPGK